MTVLTEGPVNIWPVKLPVRAGMPLTEIRSRLSERVLAPNPPSKGWADVPLGEQRTGLQDRKNAGYPTVTAVREESLLLARSMFDQRRRGRHAAPTVRERDQELADEREYELRAVDVAILSEEDGATTALISTFAEGDKALVTQMLAEALAFKREDISAATSLKPDPDMFLWLLSRTTMGQANVCPDVTLQLIRTMQARDAQSRKARILDWVDTDREEANVRARDMGSTFGPAKMVLFHHRLQLVVDWMYSEDGSFSVFVTNSYYTAPNAPDLNSADGRTQVIMNMVRDVIPTLKRAYTADAAWHKDGREQFRLASRKRLLQSILGTDCCPTCNAPL